MIHYFIWNDQDSRDMHVRVPNRIRITRPEERTERVTIPGRSGELTLTEGQNIYNGYIVTIDISIDGAEHVRAAENWLTGGGELVTDNQPDLKQRARAYSALQLEKHSRNVDRWTGSVQFYCDPVKYDRTEEDITVTTSGTTVTNPGDLRSFPLIEITGSGAVTVAAGGRTLTIPNCTSGWVIDCENEWILNGSTPLDGACSGAFPVLEPGENTVIFTGATSLTITPRFRYL